MCKSEALKRFKTAWKVSWLRKVLQGSMRTLCHAHIEKFLHSTGSTEEKQRQHYQKKREKFPPSFLYHGSFPCPEQIQGCFLPFSFSLPPSRSFLPAEILQLQQQQSICDSATTSALWLLLFHWLPYALTEVAKSAGASPFFFFLTEKILMNIHY